MFLSYFRIYTYFYLCHEMKTIILHLQELIVSVITEYYYYNYFERSLFNTVFIIYYTRI